MIFVTRGVGAARSILEKRPPYSIAALIEAINVKKKTLFELDNVPYACLEAVISTPTARGGQTLVRLKMRNLLTQAVFEKTFKAGDKFREPDLMMVAASYLYSDGEGSHFLDQQSYETHSLAGDMVGEALDFLTEGALNGNPIGLRLPPFVDLEVVATEPGVRGDTSSGSVTKSAKLETGLEIRVPLFIKEGEKVTVSTETRNFARRARLRPATPPSAGDPRYRWKLLWNDGQRRSRHRRRHAGQPARAQLQACSYPSLKSMLKRSLDRWPYIENRRNRSSRQRLGLHSASAGAGRRGSRTASRRPGGVAPRRLKSCGYLRRFPPRSRRSDARSHVALARGGNASPDGALRCVAFLHVLAAPVSGIGPNHPRRLPGAIAELLAVALAAAGFPCAAPPRVGLFGAPACAGRRDSRTADRGIDSNAPSTSGASHRGAVDSTHARTWPSRVAGTLAGWRPRGWI